MRRPRSFRSVLVRRSVLILVATLSASALATSVVLTRHVDEASRAQALKLGEGAALVSVFPLIVGRADPQEARRAATTLIGGDVIASELWIDESTPIADAGKGRYELARCHLPWPHQGSEVRRGEEGWCIFVPVFSQTSDVHVSDQVGAIKLLVSDAWSDRLRTSVLTLNGMIWAAVVLFSVFWLARAAAHALHPLVTLSASMHEAAQSGTDVRASLRGPTEILTMSNAFNALMEQLAQERGRLEQTVEERTLAFRSASDRAHMAERYTSGLMAGISHEMRTPLHVIQGYAGLARGELEFIEGSATAKNYLETVQLEAQQLLERVDELLRYSASEAGSLTVSAQACSLEDIASAVRARCEVIARSNGNEFDIQASPLSVVSDRQLLTQIASNLSTNACKFTRQGAVTTRLGYDAGCVAIEVTDNGPGMDVTVSDASAQARSSHQEMKRFKGMGLGLTLVKRFVDLLGGEIHLDSALGRGTTVRVRIPARMEQSA